MASGVEIERLDDCAIPVNDHRLNLLPTIPVTGHGPLQHIMLAFGRSDDLLQRAWPTPREVDGLVACSSLPDRRCSDIDAVASHGPSWNPCAASEIRTDARSGVALAAV